MSRIPPCSRPGGFAHDTTGCHLNSACSYLPTSCLSCSPLHPLPVNNAFPDSGLPWWPSSSHPPSPSQLAGCWLKGAEAIQGVSGRSGLTGERHGCKQKSFGSLFEDTGQLKLTMTQKGHTGLPWACSPQRCLQGDHRCLQPLLSQQ